MTVSIAHGNGPSVSMPPDAIVAGKPRPKPRAQQITWSVIASPTATSFAGNSYDRVRDAMGEVFGDFPIRLDREAHPVLLAMAAASGEGGECFRMWAKALDRYGGLELVDVE